MTDAVLSASRPQQQPQQPQPNGQPSPFSPSCRRAGGGDSGPFAECPPSGPELPREAPLGGRWRPREAAQPGGSPDGEGAALPPPPPGPPPSPPPDGPGDSGGAGGAPIPEAGRGGSPEDPHCPGAPRWRPAPGGEEERQLGKKKHRRRPSKKKRHWKPYYKLSWEEKKKFDEKQSQRASRLRAEMFAKGQPVAPYNTTQFLMEDHDQEEPDLKTGLCPKRPDDNPSSEEDGCPEEEEEALGGSDGMGGDGSEFLQRDFSETYERYHVESLQNMSKQELVREYLELEKCLSRMEEENNRLRLENKGLAGGEDLRRRLQQLERELDRLRAENQRLSRENQLARQPEKPPAQAGE